VQVFVSLHDWQIPEASPGWFTIAVWIKIFVYLIPVACSDGSRIRSSDVEVARRLICDVYRQLVRGTDLDLSALLLHFVQLRRVGGLRRSEGAEPEKVVIAVKSAMLGDTTVKAAPDSAHLKETEKMLQRALTWCIEQYYD